MSTATTTLTELQAAGLTVRAEGDRLAIQPRRLLTPDLADKAKAHKPDLLRLLDGDSTVSEGDDGAETPTEPTRAYSAAERAPADTDETDKTPAEPTYTPYEQAVLTDAGVESGSLPLLDEVKRTWPDAEVMALQRSRPQATPRREAANLIRQARRDDREHAIALRDCWEERMARVTIDGGLSEAEADHIALAELRGDTQPPKPSVDPATMTRNQLQRWISETHEGTTWHETQCEALPV